MDSKPTFKDKVNQLPLAPGIYLMKDAQGDVLYVGKARHLRNRVRSYLKPPPEYPKIAVLMSKVRDLDYIETATEVDALLLESELIKEYRPRYNKELKDDKSFPLLKISAEKFPRLYITRNKTDKQGVYYGPYTDAKLLREAVNLIHELFPLRKCRNLPKSACLYYHIGQCLAPCIKPEVKTDYDKIVTEVRGFLGGGKKNLMEYLSERMHEASRELRFEDAQFFKEQIEALGRLRKQRFAVRKQEAAISRSASQGLKKILGMEKLPEKIVCFDVSNIHGAEAVASKVSFYRELPDKLGYRRYKIKSVQGINDYAMIQEALGRMLSGIKEGRENFIPDLIMIDGGKGHLNAAAKVLAAEGFEGTQLISIAKRFETVYRSGKVPGGGPGQSPEEVLIPKDSPALYLLQKIRDEAHRFAVTYHRLLRSGDLEKSFLDEIPGIGGKRKRLLLRQFDSPEELRRAGVDQLAGLPGMSRGAAIQIWTYLHGKEPLPQDRSDE